MAVQVFFDENKQQPAGLMLFEYSVWETVPIALALWALLFVFALPFVFLEYRRTGREYSLNLELSKNEAYVALAKQVSHDIRSPLAALNFAAGELAGVPVERRRLINHAVQRINDIANDLLKTNPSEGRASPSAGEFPSSAKLTLLASIVDIVASEKRMQFRSSRNVDIRLDLSKAYGIFVEVDAREFARALSNLINNAVEAIDGQGEVRMAIATENSNAVIEIKDNGRGMTNEALKRFGERGFTVGKSGPSAGFGLGASQANEFVLKMGGRIEVESALGVGTAIRLMLPLKNPPNWHVDKIVLRPSQTLVIIDDEQTVHQVWVSRLEESSQNADLTIVNLMSFAAAAKWIEDNVGGLHRAIFLVDLEFAGEMGNGIDLIRRLPPAATAVLVTSRFSEVAVLEQVEQEGLRMIPKSLCQFVPIVIAPQHSADLIVQIDDDPLVRQVWSMLAFSKKLRMRQFGSWDEFFAVEPAIDRGARIYVDVDLGASIGGLDVSRALHEKGFENIYLSTGYYLSAEKVPPFVKGVIGKEPPF